VMLVRACMAGESQVSEGHLALRDFIAEDFVSGMSNGCLVACLRALGQGCPWVADGAFSRRGLHERILLSRVPKKWRK